MRLLRWWWWGGGGRQTSYSCVPAICSPGHVLLPLSSCFDKSRHWQAPHWQSINTHLKLPFADDPQWRFVLLFKRSLSFDFRLRPRQGSNFFVSSFAFCMSVHSTNLKASKPKLSVNCIVFCLLTHCNERNYILFQRHWWAKTLFLTNAELKHFEGRKWRARTWLRAVLHFHVTVLKLLK